MKNLIIAIGDLHGHHRALERVLDALQKEYEVFGDGGPDRLRPGVQFVFTGDYIDREFGRTSLPAFESYVVRMARTGDIGQWMRMLLPAYKTRFAGRDVLFTHADLPSEYREKEALANHLRWIDEHMMASTVGLGGSRAKWAHGRLAGIFWNRTFSELASGSQPQIAVLCRNVGVDFIVTGHTPHRAITVYGKQIFDIDAGMTPRCGGNMPQALVFSRKGIVGLRADGTSKEFVRFVASSA